MKVVQINAVCGKGSTGKICLSISKLLTERGVENYILYSSGHSDYPFSIQCSSEKYIRFQAIKARIDGKWGFHSKEATRRIISQLEQIQPDIVHLHNIHGHDCDLSSLFQYFKKSKTKIFWTFHDCWAFTGYCPHFDMVKCERWKTGCGQCPQRKTYSWFLDRSHELHERKKSLFLGQNMTIITPSQWLADLVKESFLREYPVKVVNNGIDLEVFKPTASDFRMIHHLENKRVVLGVAFGWGRRKGLDIFIELARRLDEQYQIVLVGTDDKTDKYLPKNIFSIHRTQNQKELAEIYTTADVFVNPTREENYPTVNMEALACGTPVITFKTGGSPEMLDETCGYIVECDDIDALEKEIKRSCEQSPYTQENCLHRSKSFREANRFQEYISLYEEVK